MKAKQVLKKAYKSYMDGMYEMNKAVWEAGMMPM